MNYQESTKPYLSRSMLHSWQRHGQRWVYHNINRHRLNNFIAWPHLPGVPSGFTKPKCACDPLRNPAGSVPCRGTAARSSDSRSPCAGTRSRSLSSWGGPAETNAFVENFTLHVCALRLDAPNSTNASFFSQFRLGIDAHRSVIRWL